MTISPKTRVVVTGITIELNTDEISHLIVALGDYIRLMKEHGNIKGGTSWKWIEDFKNTVENVRTAP